MQSLILDKGASKTSWNDNVGYDQCPKFLFHINGQHQNTFHYLSGGSHTFFSTLSKDFQK